jgi:hypothetical protein
MCRECEHGRKVDVGHPGQAVVDSHAEGSLRTRRNAGELLRIAQPDDGIASVSVSFDLVDDTLAFAQAAQARTLDDRYMHKYVLAAVFRLDEAEAFLDVEELYDAYTHDGLQTGIPEKSGSLRNLGR